MKAFSTYQKKCINAIALIMAIIIASSAYSQTIPELVFTNPTLVHGNDGQDGAEYRFSNVANGLDAVVEIKGRSANNVVMTNIDSTGIGWNKALQPVVGIQGNVAANQNWWMKFRLTFYQAGTNNKKKITKFYITGLDIDGDGVSLQEWVQMDKITKISFSSINNLTDNLLAVILDLLDLNNCGEDHKIMGPVTNYTNVDTAATNVMATYQYDDKDQVDFYLGGKTNSSGTTVGMRMNSLWFKQFSLAPVTLPVKIIDFSAKYNTTNVVLSWKSSEEISFSHYELEHSADGSNFETTALIFGAALNGDGAAYSYTDKTVNGRSGLIYYRLKMVDNNGKYTYSPVRIVRLGEEKKNVTMSAYPNPVTNELRITLPSSWQNKTVNIDLYTAGGQRIKNLKTNNSSQTETLIVSELGKGTYFIKAICGTETAQQTIIKN